MTTAPVIDTRTRIMDEAEIRILAQGFAATSVDSIVEGAGVTKGAFYHHFDGKDDLAVALVERWAEIDRRHLEEALERSGRLAADPVQRLMLFVGLVEESWSELVEPYAGCLFASYLAEADLFDAHTHSVIRNALLLWRTELARLLRDAAERRPPEGAFDPEATADLLTVVFEGSFVVSKTMNEADLVLRQVRQYRDYLRLLFRV